jgi:hypothetical protein
VVACESCGRYLCALCDIEFSGQHVCAKCLESAKKKGKNSRIARNYIRYDLMALRLSIYGIIPIFTPFFAPSALYICIKHRNQPCAIIPISRARLIIAGILSTLEMIFLIILCFIIFKAYL